MSHIMALNLLAPDIHEGRGKREIHEKHLRLIAAMLFWEDQRGTWKRICDEVGLQSGDLAESADRF